VGKKKIIQGKEFQNVEIFLGCIHSTEAWKLMQKYEKNELSKHSEYIIRSLEGILQESFN
jgi:hypothetical protein